MLHIIHHSQTQILVCIKHISKAYWSFLHPLNLSLILLLILSIYNLISFTFNYYWLVFNPAFVLDFYIRLRTSVVLYAKTPNFPCKTVINLGPFNLSFIFLTIFTCNLQSYKNSLTGDWRSQHHGDQHNGEHFQHGVESGIKSCKQ